MRSERLELEESNFARGLCLMVMENEKWKYSWHLHFLTFKMENTRTGFEKDSIQHEFQYPFSLNTRYNTSKPQPQLLRKVHLEP